MLQDRKIFLTTQSRKLDAPTFIDCHSTLRAWLKYSHKIGRQAIATPDKKWYGELLKKDGTFYAMLDEYTFDYFQSLGVNTNV